MTDTRPGLFRELLWREIRSRFIGSFTGWLWLIVTPLLLLAVYGFVFGVIFRARVPEGLDMPFVGWLAIALWPWLAFSESILRASESIPQHSSLISKVALPRELLALSAGTSVFLLQMAGYAAVLIALQILTPGLSWSGLPHALLILASLYLAASGLGLMMAALRVFVRDLQHLLPTLLMFWFFLTPILYAPEMLPETMREWLAWNPMTWVVMEIRAALISGQAWPGWVLAAFGLASAGIYLFGLWVFRRLSPHFEDFL